MDFEEVDTRQVATGSETCQHRDRAQLDQLEEISVREHEVVIVLEELDDGWSRVVGACMSTGSHGARVSSSSCEARTGLVPSRILRPTRPHGTMAKAFAGTTPGEIVSVGEGDAVFSLLSAVDEGGGREATRRAKASMEVRGATAPSYS